VNDVDAELFRNHLDNTMLNSKDLDRLEEMAEESGQIYTSKHKKS
jgi:hypothetical protein